MSEGTLKHTVPRYIDPRRFAHQGAKLKGCVSTEDFTRIADAGVKLSDVQVDLTFSIAVDRHNEKLVTGRILADAEMQCQRCLGEVTKHLACEVAVAVIWHEDSANELPSDLDPWVVGEDEADLYLMVEDEILLNLPHVAFHDENCIDPGLFSQGDAAKTTGADTNNPFQVLRQLKDTSNK